MYIFEVSSFKTLNLVAVSKYGGCIQVWWLYPKLVAVSKFGGCIQIWWLYPNFVANLKNASKFQKPKIDKEKSATYFFGWSSIINRGTFNKFEKVICF
jgi:hypothetical protein